MEETIKKAQEAKEKIEEKAKEFFNEFDPEKAMEDLKENMSSAADATADFVRKYPLQSLFGAAIVGFIIGANLRRK